MAETRNEAERLAAKRQAEYMGRVDKRERTSNFARTRPDHATGAHSAQRRRSADDFGEAKMAMEAREWRDEAAAQQAIEESENVVIPEKEEYDYDRAIPRGVVYGEWNIDNLGADFDGGGFDDPEIQDEYDQFRADLEYIRQQRIAREMNDRYRSSKAKGKVREVFKGEIQR